MAVLFMCTAVTLGAQSEVEALRYSQYNPFGSARYAAQGGATGALGGDFSSVLTNPAGLGFYRSSELTFSPSIYWINTTSNFYNAPADDNRIAFAVGSLGMVSSGNRNRSSGIAGFTYAFGYNTLANFNYRTTMRSSSTDHSLLDDFAWHANSSTDDLDPFYEQLAFDAYLMPYDENAGMYWHDMQYDGYGQEQHRVSEQSGHIGEYSASGAININNLIYLGGTFGLHSVRFYEEIYHTETENTIPVQDFHSFTFREFNETRGWGYTFRMGLILRPIQLIRIGGSFQLPTFYHLTNEKYSDISSTFDSSSGIPDGSESSPDGLFDYQLRTPFRATGNVSVILFKKAALSAGYEFVDYASARLDAYDYKFLEENDQVREAFRAVHNLSAGAEVRFSSLYLRGGARYMMSPYSDSRNNAREMIYSGGLGYRNQNLIFDISYTHSGSTEVYGLYAFQPGTNEVSVNDLNRNNLMFTIGFKF